MSPPTIKFKNNKTKQKKGKSLQNWNEIGITNMFHPFLNIV